MKKLEERAAAIGRAAQRRKIDEVARTLGDMGIKAKTSPDSVTLSGRYLVRRWLSDSSLRFITGLMR